jgi:hypothetical protein
MKPGKKRHGWRWAVYVVRSCTKRPGVTLRLRSGQAPGPTWKRHERVELSMGVLYFGLWRWVGAMARGGRRRC